MNYSVGRDSPTATRRPGRHGTKRKLILKCGLSPGDIVMLTAAVRDLHRCYPEQFLTDVQTLCPDLWENNPYLTALHANDPEAEILDCHYPLINQSNTAPRHCLEGFVNFLNDRLGLEIALSAFKGDIHLSAQEKAWHSQVHELTGGDTPFWIVSSGGKYDVTVKWWSPERYQRVVDHFRKKIVFVQVGQQGHHHPKLDGVIDLRGQTSLRQLVRLVYHAEGILSPITCLMHLAAAVEWKRKPRALRPCVVIAGGREPAHWEQYPGHQFIHTIGALPCCASAGCWRDRVVPLGDGDDRDQASRVCLDVVNGLPRCLDLISPEQAIHQMETYYRGKALNYTTPEQWRDAKRGIRRSRQNPFDRLPLTPANVRVRCEQVIRSIPPYPAGFKGRGIVLCGGGSRYFTNAWVCLQLLRQFGCRLPVQLWYLGPKEMDPSMIRLVEPLGVECIDASVQRKEFPCRILAGWELKCFALLRSPFEEVLLLDADNMPVANPEYLFETSAFRETGALFWPDIAFRDGSEQVWELLGLKRPRHPEFESGQILLNKQTCWRALCLSMWMNENSDFFYRYLHGDKDTFHLAFHKLNQPFTFIPTPAHTLPGTLCQHDLEGRRLFQHRNTDKWNLFASNQPVDGFWFEKDCRSYLQQLQQCWSGRIGDTRPVLNGSAVLPRRPPRIVAAMLSKGDHHSVRHETLQRLRETDWGEEPSLLELDDPECPDPKEAQQQSAFRLLNRFLQGAGDYLLCLQDSLAFNRHLRHNLEQWRLLRFRLVGLASLFNPGVLERGCDVANHAYIVSPARASGSLAWLLSRRTVKYLTANWDKVDDTVEIRIAQLAGRLRHPIYFHSPSLVQRVEGCGKTDPPFPLAADFDAKWKTEDQ